MQKMENDFLRLPLLFDIEKLEIDLNKALHQNWPKHFNTNNYTGNWTAISLRSPNGNSNVIFANTNSNYVNTKLLDKCFYFKEILKKFKCELEAVRLLKLDPNSEIKEHSDHKLGYDDGAFRIHIPIKTNENVNFIVNAQKIIMKPGTCWYANFNLPHSVTNNGNSPRIHLVIDCIRNTWSNSLFKECGYNFDLKEENGSNPENIPKIIEQLRLIGSKTAEEMIIQLEKKIEPKKAL